MFARAESLFYYARIGRTGPSGLSEAEIQSLLGQSQAVEGSVTEVDPSRFPPGQQLQEDREGSGSGPDGAPQSTWNKTNVAAHEIDEEGRSSTIWTSTDVQPHPNEGRPTSWNKTFVDRVGEESIDGVEAVGTAEVVRGVDQRPTTADKLLSSGGRRKRHKKEGHRKSSATGRRGTEGTEEESFVVDTSVASWQGDDRIRFYNNREEVPPPPLTAGSRNSQTSDDNVLLPDYLHGNHDMYPVQEGMEDAVDADGSIPAHHRSMLLGTEKGDWSASQLFMYESQLSLTGLDQSQLEGHGG